MTRPLYVSLAEIIIHHCNSDFGECKMLIGIFRMIVAKARLASTTRQGTADTL